MTLQSRAKHSIKTPAAFNLAVLTPIAEFMGVALGHASNGYYYYMPLTCDVFGKDGDFTKSNTEIFSVFGELIGVWCVSDLLLLVRGISQHLGFANAL